MVKFHTEKLPDGNYQIFYDEPGSFTVNKKKVHFPAGKAGVIGSLNTIKNARSFYVGPDVFVPGPISFFGNVCVENSRVTFTNGPKGVANVTSLRLKNVCIVDSTAIFSSSSVEKSNIFRSELSKCNVSNCTIKDTFGINSSFCDSTISSSKIEHCNISLSHVSISEMQKIHVSNSALETCKLDDCIIESSVIKDSNFTSVKIYDSRISQIDHGFILPSEVIRSADIRDSLDFAVLGLSLAYRRKGGKWFFMTKALFQFAAEIDENETLSIKTVDKNIQGKPSSIALDYYYLDVDVKKYFSFFSNCLFKNHEDRFLLWLKKYAFMSHIFCTSLLFDFDSSFSNMISDKLLFDIKTKHIASNVVLFDKSTLNSLQKMRISYAFLDEKLENEGAVVM